MATIALFLVSVLSLLLFDPSVTAYLYNEPSWVWRFVSVFTHMVSHGSWDHLIGNFLFGGPYLLYLEYTLKSSKKFVRAFFMFGFASLAAQIILDKFSLFHSMGLIGSSGAIFGVVGAALMLPKKNKLSNVISKLVLIFFIYNQVTAAKLSLIWPSGVAYGAHLGGLIAGVLFSLRHRPGRHHRRR